MGSAPPSGIAAGEPTTPERFDELLLRLRALVERLEGGHISLEDGLRCFEEGMILCKRGAEILDTAERRVEVLLGTNQRERDRESSVTSVRTTPFEPLAGPRDDHE